MKLKLVNIYKCHLCPTLLRRRESNPGPFAVCRTTLPTWLSSPPPKKKPSIHYHRQWLPNTEWSNYTMAGGKDFQKRKVLRQFEWKTPWEMSTTGPGSEPALKHRKISEMRIVVFNGINSSITSVKLSSAKWRLWTVWEICPNFREI